MQDNDRSFQGAFLADGDLELHGSGAYAVGDTMSGGRIFFHGDTGDATGYAMRQGALYIRGSTGDRAGIHMKTGATLLIGGSAGAYLGEYQAGGTIIVLGLEDRKPLLGADPCAGMHGGTVFLRGSAEGIPLPSHISVSLASQTDMDELLPHLQVSAERFGWDLKAILSEPFSKLTPQTHRPYKAMYTPI